MKKEALRKKVIGYLVDADEELLSKVNEVISDYKKSEIVGYRVNGEPITKEQLLEEIKISEQQIKDGNYITAEALREEIKTWGK